jgi:dihydroxyacid dehydratase/phosphogluconate dehydratase
MAIIKVKDCLNCHIPHEWDFEGFTLKEMRTVKKLTGMSGKAYGDAASEMDPEAIAVMVYVLHTRDKIKIPFNDIDLDFSDFEMEETEEETKAREAAEAEAAEKGKAEDE